MELGNQIKKYRADNNLSQEELAEKIYVTRQTISNWETGKSYPDIHSLLLMSTLFHISLDQLIKGDIETMKEEIKQSELNKFNFYGTLYTILLVLMIVSVVPLAIYLGIGGLLIWGVIAALALMVAYKVEAIKKENDVFTYKEIVAFTEGKRLDEMDKKIEKAKRPYQVALLMLASGGIALIVCVLMMWLLL